MFARKQLQALLSDFGRKIFEALLMVSPEIHAPCQYFTRHYVQLFGRAFNFNNK
jgi:hypothetical protein